MGFAMMALINSEVAIDYTHYVCQFYSVVGKYPTDVTETRIILASISGVKIVTRNEM